MAVNIGPKIGIDGEKEYRKQINELITQQKTFSAEMRELESSFDDSTSAMEQNRKKSALLEKAIKNQEKQVEELEKGLKASADKYGDNATETQKWKQAVSNAKTELNKMRSELDKVPKSLSQVGKGMQNVGKKMQSVGDTLTKKVSAPLTAFAAASIAAWKEVDEGLDIVAKKTGATGAELAGLQESAKNVATTIPTSFADAGTAIGEVNTKFGVTGTELESLTTKFIKFAEVNDTDVNSSIDGVQKVMAAFGLETKDAGALMDAMTKTGQKTGVSMDALQGSMVKNAAAMQEMGLDAYSAAGFLGSVEMSGANTETVMAGLTKALSNANAEGKTLPQALGEFQSIMSSSASDQEKLNAAIELFGKKAGPAIYEACKQGSLSFENLSADASEYMGAVEKTFDAVIDPADNFQVALNKVKAAGSEIGGTLLQIAAPAIEKLGDYASDAADWFNSLTTEQQETVAYAATFAAGVGPVISVLGRIASTAGTVVEKIGSLEALPGFIGALASPAGVGALAVGALAIALNTMDQDVGYLNEDIQTLVTDTSAVVGELDTATDSLSSTMEESKKSIDDINAQADTANALVDELAQLEKQSSLTAVEQGRMRTIVGELNAMYPDLGVQIDASTGKLSKSTGEIKKYIKNARDMALLEAYTKAASKGYEELAEASIALTKARDQESKNLETINDLEAQKADLDNAIQDSAGNIIDATGNLVMTYDEYEKAMTDVSNDLETARGRQEELTTETEKAQGVYDEAEETISMYETEAENLSDTLHGTEEATESDTAAVEANTEATAANAEANRQRAAALVDTIATAVTKIGEEITAWDDLYTATRESIENQVGLFDEWKEDTEVTADSILANLQSQIKGMTSYNSNMKKLSEAAVKSADPNFKALVQSINDMGVDGAAYAQVLVDAMENDKDKFNEILTQYGSTSGIKDDLAETSTYIASDFTTRTGAAIRGVISAVDALGKTKGFTTLKTGAQNAVATVTGTLAQMVTSAGNAGRQTDTNLKAGYSGLPGTAKAAASRASAESKAVIDGTKYNPKVDKVGVTNSAISGAEKSISDGVKPTVKVASISTGDAISSAWQNIQNYFNRNPITATVRQIIQKVTGAAHNANGGIIENETLSWLAEGDKPEAVIPLDASKRSRALALYQQTGELLGIDNSIKTSTTLTLPDGQQSTANSDLTIGFDDERLYQAVATAAMQGMENANIRIYMDSRETGRVLRDMGVQFA